MGHGARLVPHVPKNEGLVGDTLPRQARTVYAL